MTTMSAKQKRANYINSAAQMMVSIPESVNFGAIFILHHTPHYLYLLFHTALRFVLFPIAAIATIANAAFDWHRYLNDLDEKTGKRKTFNLIRAIWDTLQAGGTTGAVITGIVGAALGVAVGFGIALTFTVLLASSTIFQAIVTGYFAYQAYKSHKAFLETGDAQHKKAYSDLMSAVKNSAFATMIIGMLCTGIVLAMVAGFPLTGAIIGAVTCGVGIAFAAYNLYKHYQTRPKWDVASSEPLLAQDELSFRGTTSRLTQQMPLTPTAEDKAGVTTTVTTTNTMTTTTVTPMTALALDTKDDPTFQDLDANKSYGKRPFN